MIGLKWKPASCDRLGEVDDDSPDNSPDTNSSDQEDSNDQQDKALDGHNGWDTAWIQQKVKSWGSQVKDGDFEKRWQDAVDGTWLSKFKAERPSWVR